MDRNAVLYKRCFVDEPRKPYSLRSKIYIVRITFFKIQTYLCSIKFIEETVVKKKVYRRNYQQVYIFSHGWLVIHSRRLLLYVPAMQGIIYNYCIIFTGFHRKLLRGFHRFPP